jgi:hypothetical protein
MGHLPRLFGVAFVGLALAGGSHAVLADDMMPGNGSLVGLSAPLPPSAQGSLLPTDGGSGLGLLAQKLGIQNGHLDFFSVRPDSSGDLKQLMRGQSAPGGGLKLQFKW